jgi:group I intron endonuclease
MDKVNRKLSKNPIYGIYQIKNLINGKVYIGQSKDIERRWEQHKYVKNATYISRAIKKYGVNNFEFTTLEEIDEINNNLLMELEQKWMDNKKSYNKKYGYNLNEKSKVNYTEKRNKDFGLKISKIKKDMNHCGKNITQFSKDGFFIKTWKSAAEVERILNIKATNISRVCLKKQKSAGNFIWRFENEQLTSNEIIEINTQKRNRKRVLQMDMDFKPLNQFNSLIEACNHVKGKYIENIINVCKGNNNSYMGFKWKYL